MVENGWVSLVQDSEDAEDVNQTVPTIWNYFKVVGVQSKKGGAKNVTCNFCDKTLTGCSSSRALAHILGRPVLEQSKANVRFCVPIRKEDDNQYEQFKTAQKVLNKQVRTKEAQLSSSKSRQTVLDLTSLGKRTVTGEMKTVESKTLDSAIANVFYENALPFNVADSPSLAHMVEKCIEFGQQHPGRKYKAQNRKRIGGALLDTAYEDTAASVQPIVDRAKKYGATLTSDGWSDGSRRVRLPGVRASGGRRLEGSRVVYRASPGPGPGRSGSRGAGRWFRPGSRVAGRRSATPRDPANPGSGRGDGGRCRRR